MISIWTFQLRVGVHERACGEGGIAIVHRAKCILPFVTESLSRRGKKAVAKEAGEVTSREEGEAILPRDARVAVGVHRVDAARRGGEGARGAACACSADALGKGARPGGAGPVL